MVGHGAKTWIEINSEALCSNIRQLKSQLEPGSRFCAVVKGNAYGHDMATIARLAATENVDLFAVDSIDEAVALRRQFASATIFVLGATVPERLPEVLENNLIQTVYSLPIVDELIRLASDRQAVAQVSIKVETGTNRQGAGLNQLPDLLRAIKQNERSIRLCGVSSHFADSENADDQNLSQKQFTTFQRALVTLQQYEFNPPYVHMACSAAALLHPEAHFSMARFGIALYGLWSSESLRRTVRLGKAVELRPVLSWKTRVVQLKDVAPGEYIGYARAYLNDRPRRIAVLPVGYYDGYRRAYARDGEVLIRGTRCAILGKICMNMMMVDVSLLPQAKIDDVVTLLGRDGMHQITAEDLAQRAETINYEVVTTINPLLPRIVT